MTITSGESQWLKHFITEDLFIVEDSLRTPMSKDSPEKPTLDIDETPTIGSIVVILTNPGSEPIGKTSMAFLRKVLGAVQLKLEDTTIIDTFNEPDLLMKVSPARCEKIILFHPTLNLDGFNESTMYKVHKTPTSSILRTDLLPEIEADTSKKRALWSALQSMFEIS